MKGGMSGGGQQAPAPNPISSWFGGARNAISQAIANAMKARTICGRRTMVMMLLGVKPRVLR